MLATYAPELRRRRSVDVVFVDALFTVIAGSFLHWHTHPGFNDRIVSSFGAWGRAGALLAISGLVVGAVFTRPTNGRLVSLGRRVAESGGAPTPETGARIGVPQRRLVVAERVSFSLVLLAVVAMAPARYP
jgi:hypothetical protein